MVTTPAQQLITLLVSTYIHHNKLKFNLLLNLFKAAFLFVPYLTQDNKKFQTLQLTIHNIISAFQLLTKPIFFLE